MDNGVRSPVLLIDVDNVVGVASTPRPGARARLVALLIAAGPVHHAVAAYNARTDQADDPLASHLAELGVGCIQVDGRPEAADLALLEHARRVRESRAHGDFVIASADGRFAQLAALGRLEVLAWQGQPVSARLRRAAHRLHRVPRPDHLSHAEPARAEAPVPGQVDTDAVRTGTRPSPPRPAGRAAAVLGMAFATGMCAGLGQRLANALPPARR